MISSRPSLIRTTASCRVKASPSPHLWLHNPTFPFPEKRSKNLKLNATNSDLENTRPLIKFPPSLWADRFLSVPVEDELELNGLTREIEDLKSKVREKLAFSPSDNDKERIRSIHLLISLGLSYHFESEIEDTLDRAFGNLAEIIADEYDLHTISIMFQVFRLYGHNMSCDVFDRFKGDDGKFRKNLEMDVRAMLSLYEAAHLGTTSNDMDEAMSFTSKYLESLPIDLASPHLYSLIRNALYQPRYHNMEILFAREYISFYEQEEDRDEILLKFAKLNFRRMQLHYIQELEIVSKWWKGLDLPSKLPYFRDRIVESYFATVGVYPEPRYSFQRTMVTKLFIIATVTVVDDSCDAYVTLPEVASLVHGLERWDFGVIDSIPDYMKIVLRHALLILSEVEREVKPEVRSQIKQETMEELKIIMRAFLQIAQWARAGHVPTFEEYMEVGLVTTGIELLMKLGFVWMEHTNSEECLRVAEIKTEDHPNRKCYVPPVK